MRHHYIPQFLLRAWSETMPDGKVEVFRLDLPNLPSTRRTPKNTAYEDDLYALTRPIVAGMEKHAVEVAILRQVDDLAARVRRKLVDTGFRSLSLSERCDWVRFLMSLQLRQPNIILQLCEETSDHLRQSLADQPEQYEALSQEESIPTLECWVEQHFPGLIENFGLTFFHDLINDAKVGEQILRMKWWLWDFSRAGRELVLSDRPCILTRASSSPCCYCTPDLSDESIHGKPRCPDSIAHPAAETQTPCHAPE